MTKIIDILQANEIFLLQRITYVKTILSMTYDRARASINLTT